MKIPEKIKHQANDLIELFGDNITYIGKYQGQEVFQFILPADQENGFPIVYLYDPKSDKVETVGGMDAIDLLNNIN